LQQERRQYADRRKKTLSPFSLVRLHGKRRKPVRSDDADISGQIDWYHSKYLLLSMLILVLCGMDSHNTLALLQFGGRELNPFMDVLIRIDVTLFVLGKFALTGLGMIILVAYHHRRFLFFKVRYSLYVILAIYIVLICYQILIFPAGINILFP